MVMLAATATGAAVWLLVAALSGRPIQVRGRRPARPQTSAGQTWLLQAGAQLTPRQFVAGSVLVGAATLVCGLALTATPAVAVVPAIAAGMLPRAWFARSRARRLRELQEAWPDGLRDLVAATSAGRSLHQALLGLASDGPPALRRALQRYPGLARMLGVVPALELLAEELADPTSDRVIEVLILAHSRGGHLLTEILRDLADATTRDVRTLDEIRTEGMEQRINARAVFVLPWLVLLALTARDGFFRDFYRSGAGVAVVGLGAALSLVGLAIVARLSRDPVEPRVLGAAAPATARDGEAR